MNSLVRPVTMRNAGLAALLTAAGAYPRLTSWSDLPGSVWLLLSVILMAAYLLWSFVFAWHERESGRKVFTLEGQARPWAIATAAGICGAVLLYFWIDPISRQINPLPFPKSFAEWMGNLLFTLGFEQLFVCFAPFAFFIRLAHRRDVAFVLTVVFGVMILCLQLEAAEQLSVSVVAIKLLLARMVVNSFTIGLYLRGGVLMAWWWVLLLNVRHLADLF